MGIDALVQDRGDVHLMASRALKRRNRLDHLLESAERRRCEHVQDPDARGCRARADGYIACHCLQRMTHALDAAICSRNVIRSCLPFGSFGNADSTMNSAGCM